jgi:hypothetical protein
MSRLKNVLALLVITALASSCPPRKHIAITEADLVRNTQEMCDAVAAGDQAPWQKYFADDSMYSTRREEAWTKPLSSKT